MAGYSKSSIAKTLVNNAAYALNAGNATSASYALTASYAMNGGGGGGGTPGGSDTYVQYNNAGNFGGEVNFKYDYTNNILYLTGSQKINGSISASYGPNTVGFYGTASWAVSASQALTSSYAITASYTINGSPSYPEYSIQYYSQSAFGSNANFTYDYTKKSLNVGNILSPPTSQAPYSINLSPLITADNGLALGSGSIVIGGGQALGITSIAIAGGIAYFNKDIAIQGGFAYGQYGNCLAIGGTARGNNSIAFYGSETGINSSLAFAHQGGKAFAQQSHAEGAFVETYGFGSHAEGYSTQTSVDGYASHAEGYYTTASGYYSHAEGGYTITNNYYAHSEGELTQANGYASHAEGYNTIALGNYSHTEGSNSMAYAKSSHAEGINTSTIQGSKLITPEIPAYYVSTSFHTSVLTIVDDFLAFTNTYILATNDPNWDSLFNNGYNQDGSTFFMYVTASGTSGTEYQKIEFTYQDPGGLGGNSLGVGWYYILAEPYTIGFTYSDNTSASGSTDNPNSANGDIITNYIPAVPAVYSPTKGQHAEGYYTVAYGDYSHAEGIYTIASGSGQTVIGQYNLHNNITDLLVVGDGTDNSNRHDILNIGVGYVNITGSSSISGSLLVTNGITGSLFGTSSWAYSSSQAISSSYALSASYALSSSFVESSSFIFVSGTNDNTTYKLIFAPTSTNPEYKSLLFDSGSAGLRYNASTNTLFGSKLDFTSITGSISGNITGSIYGTASWAESASQALTASYITGSIFNNTNPVLSASYASTASNSLLSYASGTNANTTYKLIFATNSTTPEFKQLLFDSGSAGLRYNASTNVLSGNTANFSNITGSLFGTSSWAESSSFTITSSYITGSVFNNTNPALSSSYSLSSSYTLTASYASTASYLLPIRSGFISASQWNTGSAAAGSAPFSASITFSPPFPTTGYSVAFTGISDSRFFNLINLGRGTNFFRVSSNSAVPITGSVTWIAVLYSGSI